MRPHGKYAAVDATRPEAFAQCDRCGFWYNRSRLAWQNYWAGTHLYNTGYLVCDDRCLDIPNEQLRTIILPPDPPPVINSRVPDFTYEEDGPVQTTLSENVNQGVLVLPVVSVTGFVVGDNVWVQLNNASFASMEVTAINTVDNELTIAAPLPYSAAYTGSVTVATENA